ncbi:hypothetical protein ACQ4PT_051772 [Festuca glaucescens]
MGLRQGRDPYALEHDEMFNSDEVIQWESGKTINTIAAAQGISIRRRCRPRYPSEGSGDDKVVPRDILEQIIWDKERKAKKPLRSVMESSEHAPPVEIAQAYEENGAACISILTDEKHFQGSFENLETGRNSGVKVHDERELDRVLKLDGVELIGINNRSLETFVLDTSNTRMLMEKRGDIIRDKGIMVLVGESLIKAEDPGRAIAGLFGKELLC